MQRGKSRQSPVCQIGFCLVPKKLSIVLSHARTIDVSGLLLVANCTLCELRRRFVHYSLERPAISPGKIDRSHHHPLLGVECNSTP